MTDTIQQTLSDIAHLKNVNVLFAVESGSRAWGFESRDSDWDVRFIYLDQPRRYLTVFPQRDVIENEDLTQLGYDPLLDFSGWDLRKFFQLLSKSNPTAFEWLQSPIVYREADVWAEVRRLAPQFFSPKESMHHYLSMAKHNFREHMRDGQSEKVRLKKYLYITRPLLCCRWIELFKTPPPMRFDDVLRMVPAGPTGLPLKNALEDLVQRKKAGDELDEGPAIAEINTFIEIELGRLPEVANALPAGKGALKELDDLFYHTVEAMWRESL